VPTEDERDVDPTSRTLDCLNSAFSHRSIVSHIVEPKVRIILRCSVAEKYIIAINKSRWHLPNLEPASVTTRTDEDAGTKAKALHDRC
jgi:hypothetical protein